MSGRHDLSERLRAARPSAYGSPPSLESVMVRARQAPPGRAQLRGARLALLAALAALAIVGSAWAASTLLSGSIVVTGFPPVSPGRGAGAPLPGNPVLGLRVADPVGGLPWGVRVVRTTRGEACLQVGRILDGKIGVLGAGHAFNADGRFHVLSPEDALGLHCTQLAQGGRFINVQGPMTVSADGLSLAESMADRVHCDLPGQHDWGIRCPRSELRLLAFGALGPDASALTVTYRGRTLKLKPYGPDGLYLLVLSAPPGTNVGYFGAQAPAPPSMTVSFTNGSSCPLPSINDPFLCSAPGVVFARGPAVGVDQVATRIHAVYRAQVRGGESPLSIPGPSSAAASPIPDRPGPALLLSFTARVAVHGPGSTYGFEITRPVVPGCFGEGALVSNQASPSLRAGQRTGFKIRLEPSCRGLYSGRVFYLADRSGPEPRGEERLIEQMSERFVRRGLHLAPPGVTVGRFAVELP
jgi:hypothetical protein